MRLLGRDLIKLKKIKKIVIGLKKKDTELVWGNSFNMDFIKEFWEFLKVRKKYWLLPIIIV